MKKLYTILLSTALLVLSSSMTITKTDEKNPADGFDINNYTWLAGHWTGDGFGGTSDEVWSMPANGTMMGVYRNIQDGKVIFYEFLTLDASGMKLKHFNHDMKAWEEKEDFVHFELIEATADKLTFKGLVFEKKSDTEMDISLKMKENGKIHTEVFHMKRIQP